ncbi:importin-13 [Toxorhynchites rutilus septentrionalis]|uniref:importin-13 n=1 Tax=Toxorhynchites rutilus septentrionalis TaxID=329112 RepID=UPI00247940B3|nr:importin-13 [Toxorhynchites rutilus septentrionalis]
MDVRTIEEAVLTFYRSVNTQEDTHQWLQQIQDSPQAWSFCWELMQPSKPSEIQFFGAITLHSKLTKHWAEVPKEAHNEFKQKILECIVVFGNGPRIVLSQLCISLSVFIVHMLEHPMVIEEFTNMFLNEQLGTLSKNTQLEILLSVLEGIPHEVDTAVTIIPRSMVRGELNKKAQFTTGTVLNFLSGKFNGDRIEESETSTLITATKCISSWLKYGNIRLDECEAMVEVFLKVVHYCYWKEPKEDGCLSQDDNDLAEAAVKALVKVMGSQSNNGFKFSSTVVRYMRLFLDVLVPILDVEWKENNDNENLAFVIYTLFLTTLECYASVIFAGMLSDNEELTKVYGRTVELLVKCTDKPGTYPVDELSSTLAMEFWYMLQDEVFSMPNDENKTKCWESIKPIYAHIVKVLIRKSQLPNEKAMHKWNQDDLETFRCYRQDIGDTLLSCHDVLNDLMLDVLSNALDDSILYLNYDQQSTDCWPLLEATIHAYCSIAQKIEYGEYPQIVKLLKVLNEIPYEKYSDKLLGMALETVGAYSDWISENPTYLASAIELLVKGLSSTQASQATLGLKDLTSQCQNAMAPFAIPLLDACQAALGGGHLKNSELIRLMYTVGNIMSVISYEEIIRYLDIMVSPCFEELQVIVQNQDKSDAVKVRVILRLEMISKVFSSLNVRKPALKREGAPQPVQPILLILEKTMVLLKNLCTLWLHDESVIETLCRALQQALSNLVDDIKPLLNDLCCLILLIFANKCAPSAVEMAGNVILIFYNDLESRESMKQMFSAILEYNFDQMKQYDDQQKLSDVADLIEAFFMFNTKITKKIPLCYVPQGQAECTKLVEYAMKGMMLPETGPMKKSVGFLTAFIKESRNLTQMSNAVVSQGENMVRTTFLCLGGYTPRAHVDVFADIFLALNYKYPIDFTRWIEVLLRPDFPTPFVTANDKDQFIKKVLKEKVNRRLVQEYVRKFSAMCRNVVEWESDFRPS